MPKRSSKAKTVAKDGVQTAFDALQRVISLTEQAEQKDEKNPAAVALGRRGGLKGGPARRDALSATRRREIAKAAAAKRWAAQRKRKA
jgi:hypothetical protein